MHHLKTMRPRTLVAVVLMIIVVISLHAVGGLLLVQTGLGAISLHSPLTSVVIGALVALAMFKLKHVLGFLRRKHHSRQERSSHKV